MGVTLPLIIAGPPVCQISAYNNKIPSPQVLRLWGGDTVRQSRKRLPCLTPFPGTQSTHLQQHAALWRLHTSGKVVGRLEDGFENNVQSFSPTTKVYIKAETRPESKTYFKFKYNSVLFCATYVIRVALFNPPYAQELKYGTGRMFHALSAWGFSFPQYLNGCKIVVGQGVFGMFGLFMADMLINFESIAYPVLRGIAIAGFLVFFLISVITEDSGVSHLSHFGGLISGLFPSFLFLPNFVKEDWEVHLPHCGLAVIIIVFIIFPIVIYQHTLPGITC